MRGSAIVAMAAVFLSSCQTYYPTRQAYREVRITSDPTIGRACLYLGHEVVRAKGLKVGNSAMAAMKNRAAQRRGNVVVSDGPRFKMPGPSATMSGEVYAC